MYQCVQICCRTQNGNTIENEIRTARIVFILWIYYAYQELELLQSRVKLWFFLFKSLKITYPWNQYVGLGSHHILKMKVIFLWLGLKVKKIYFWSIYVPKFIDIGSSVLTWLGNNIQTYKHRNIYIYDISNKCTSAWKYFLSWDNKLFMIYLGDTLLWKSPDQNPQAKASVVKSRSNSN